MMSEDGPFDNLEKSADPHADGVPNPRSLYSSPEQVKSDPNLSEEEKLAILTEWKNEVDDRLKAEEEGMSASDPIHQREEAALANEATKVSEVLEAISPAQADTPDPDSSNP